MGVGVVIIGRNEGERLRSCLRSVSGSADRVVYVDSGSADGSVEMARGMFAEVVELDVSIPFTAARARNAGFARLRSLSNDIPYVQFVDGDCEVAHGWLETATRFLARSPAVAVVCGRTRERYPERSVYNLLCDIEWETPLGESKSCGGNAMLRADALASVAGFREELIAGEEPELCVRLRRAGWKVWRLGEEMAVHDVAMTRFSQWWQRAMRGGYAFAEGASLHGAAPERHWVRESRSGLFWGLGIPFVVLVGLVSAGSWALLLLLSYPLQVARLFLRGRRSPRENLAHAFFLVLGKFPGALGQMKYAMDRLRGTRPRLIEYK